jgi:nucleoporin SEH1
MATVSSDQKLKIFDLNDAGEWELSDSFKAHDASINRVRLCSAISVLEVV